MVRLSVADHDVIHHSILLLQLALQRFHEQLPELHMAGIHQYSLVPAEN